jgi:hypothetical protein
MEEVMPQAPRQLLPESEVTPPSEWCPHPERWTSTDDESTEVEVSELIGAFTRAVQPDNVLETGTAFGQTTRAIAQSLDRNGHGMLWTVDLSKDRQAKVAEGMGHPANVTFVQASSFDWEPPADTRFQLAFIDCDFGARGVVFCHFSPWFSPGTIVAFHDISPGFTNGPHGWGAGMPLLTPLVEEGLLRLITLHTPRGIALGEVL